MIRPVNLDEPFGGIEPIEELTSERERHDRITVAVQHQRGTAELCQQSDSVELICGEAIECTEKRLRPDDRCLVGKAAFENEAVGANHAGAATGPPSDRPQKINGRSPRFRLPAA